MKNIVTLVNENKMLRKNVRDLQEQLQVAYKKVYELTERLNSRKVKRNIQSEKKYYD
jgi:sugar-specific transcriptional regulator TrmB